MSLNAWERRELDEIERALCRTNPRLARSLATPLTDRATLFIHWLSNAFLAVVVLLIGSGLVLADGGLVVGGCLVLVMMPITVCLVGAAQKRRGSGHP